MTKTKTTAILFALTASLYAVPSANAQTAAPVPYTLVQDRPSPQRCPACGMPMLRKWMQVRPGQWAWVWWCPEPTCN